MDELNKDDLFDEEVEQDPTKVEGEEDLFEDDEEEETPEPERKPSITTDKDNERLTDAIRRKDMAFKKEKDKRKALEAQIEAYKSGQQPTVDAAASAVPTIDASAIAKKVREDMQKEDLENRKNQYLNSAKEEIRKLPGITKELAKEVLDAVGRLPGSTNPLNDVEYAYGFIMQRRNTTFSTPPTITTGYTNTYSNQGNAGVIESAKQQGQQFGLSPEDYDKHWKNKGNPSIFRK